MDKRKENETDYEKELKKINLDVIFFFLLVVASLISFYIIIEKKKKIQNQPSISDKESNKIYNFNKYLIIIIDIYFLINSYLTLQDLNKTSDATPKQIKDQKILIISNLLALIAALLYLPLRSSNVEVNE